MVYIYIYVPYVHNPESTLKIFLTQLKKGNGRLGKLTMNTVDSSMMKKTVVDSKTKGRKPGSTCGLLDNSCQGKDTGVFLNSD